MINLKMLAASFARRQAQKRWRRVAQYVCLFVAFTCHGPSFLVEADRIATTAASEAGESVTQKTWSCAHITRAARREEAEYL